MGANTFEEYGKGCEVYDAFSDAWKRVEREEGSPSAYCGNITLKNYAVVIPRVPRYGIEAHLALWDEIGQFGGSPVAIVVNGKIQDPPPASKRSQTMWRWLSILSRQSLVEADSKWCDFCVAWQLTRAESKRRGVQLKRGEREWVFLGMAPS